MEQEDQQRTEDVEPVEPFQPEDVMVVSSLETLRLISDPARLSILEALADRTQTVKQIAKIIGTSPTKLYYHINMLEERGLIKVVGSRIVSGIIEKQYRGAARSLRIDRRLFAPSGGEHDESVERLLSVMFDSARDTIKRAFGRGDVAIDESSAAIRNAMLARTIMRLTPERFEEMRERLKAVIDEYSPPPDDETEDEGARLFGLVIALYPIDPSTGDD